MADFRYNKAGLLQTNFKIEGLKELEAAVKKLREEMGGRKQENIIANSLRVASKETMLKPMQNYIARYSRTGKLLRGLSVKRHPRPSSWTELFGIGAHKLGRRPENVRTVADLGGLPWYAAIVEYGGKGKKGPHKGWMRRTAEENSAAFIRMFADDAGKRIEKAAKKIGNENLRAMGSKIRGLNVTKV